MMDLVILERRPTPPIGVADVETMDRQAQWCMQQYRVRHVTSLLSLDGHRLVCAFAAPDVEAVRDTMRRLGESSVAPWAASVHGPPHLAPAAPLPPTASTLVVVERTFPEPVDFEAIQAIEDRGAWCLEVHHVRFLRTYFARDRRRMICLYEAPDAESVRLAQYQAGMALERAWPALPYEPPG